MLIHQGLKGEGCSCLEVRHTRLALLFSTVVCIVQNHCNSIGEKAVALSVCQWPGSRAGLWGMMTQTCRASLSIKKFDNSIIGLPVVEDNFIPSLFSSKRRRLQRSKGYGLFIQTISALQNSVPGVKKMTAETCSV